MDEEELEEEEEEERLSSCASTLSSNSSTELSDAEAARMALEVAAALGPHGSAATQRMVLAAAMFGWKR